MKSSKYRNAENFTKTSVQFRVRDPDGASQVEKQGRVLQVALQQVIRLVNPILVFIPEGSPSVDARFQGLDLRQFIRDQFEGFAFHEDLPDGAGVGEGEHLMKRVRHRLRNRRDMMISHMACAFRDIEQPPGKSAGLIVQKRLDDRWRYIDADQDRA